MAEKFKFNNSAMWSEKEDDPQTLHYFYLGEDNFKLFTKYIKEQDKVPISLSLT